MKQVDASKVISIVEKYNGFVMALCRRYYIVGGTAEDLFEEGVIGILEACQSYKGESFDDIKFDNFVKICIKRQIFDAIRKSNAQKNKILNESVSFISIDENGEERSKLDTIVDRNSSNDPMDIFIDKEKFDEKLRECKKELSKFEFEVLEKYLDGEKQSEIARDMNKDIKSIDNTIQRIKNKFK